MNNLVYTVFDIETDGLLDELTKIHCLSYAKYHNGKLLESSSITDYEEMKNFIESNEVLVGHNIILYDLPALAKILDLDIKPKTLIIDTLVLSWHLYDKRLKHGLEDWGEEFGVPKPKILNWDNLPIEDYIHRCEEDVKINSLLFLQQFKYLSQLYNLNWSKIRQLLNYFNFKMNCIKEQEEVKTLFNIEKINKHLSELELLAEEKFSKIREAMPLDIKYKQVSKPTNMFKKNGELSVKGKQWLDLLSEQNLPEDWEEPIDVEIQRSLGNPASNIQLKNWLFSLGWKPITFKERKNKAGELKKVPQIYLDSSICESIKKLFEIEPRLENLDQLTLINHRIGVFKGFLEEIDNEGYARASIKGLTSTLRFQHKRPISNLPKVGTFYGEEIRGSIIAPKGYKCCGSDMSALEDTTKQHYMYYFDPEYVTEMRTPGFDPHLDVAVLAGLLTPEQSQEHKDGIKKYTAERNLAKTVNFSSIYGAGPPKIASSTGMSLEQAQALHKTYWERNKAVKLVAENCTVKVFYNDNRVEKYKQNQLNQLIRAGVINENDIKQLWILQPISKFWYPLRYLKDSFSAINQSSGVYCFDLWVQQVRSRGIKVRFQYHDNIFVVNKPC